MKTLLTLVVLSTTFIACNHNGSPRTENSSQAGVDSSRADALNAVEDSSTDADFKPEVLVETILFDADLDGQIDTVRLFRPPDWADPGDYHFISIRLASKHHFSLGYKGGWSSLMNESDSTVFPTLRKLTVVQSQNIFALRIDSASTAVLLFGVQYASSPGQLTVLKVLRDTVRIVYRDDISISSITDVDGDGVPDLIGAQYIEAWEADSVRYETYNPYEIVSLASFRSVDQSIVNRYNDEHYFGTPQDRTTGPYVVVRLKNRKPFIMSEAEAYSKYGQ